MSRVHELGCFEREFQPILDGRKTFYVAQEHASRRFEPGDLLQIKEVKIFVSASKPPTPRRTGFEVSAIVRYIVRGPDLGLPLGRCVMSIEVVTKVTPGIKPGQCDASA